MTMRKSALALLVLVAFTLGFIASNLYTGWTEPSIGISGVLTVVGGGILILYTVIAIPAYYILRQHRNGRLKSLGCALTSPFFIFAVTSGLTTYEALDNKFHVR